MKYKRLEKSRCPWCGEILDLGNADKNGFKITCTHCKNVSRYSWFEMGTIISVFIGVVILGYGLVNSELNELRHYYALAIVPPMIYHFLIWLYRPMQCVGRSKSEKRREYFLGRANVCWYSYKQGGIGFAYFRLINSMIFPVCFLDEKGNPVSQTVCVRFKKGLGFLWNYTKITLISDHL